MAENFPIIEPSSFDLIVIGTGLQESILAAGAAAIGRRVLHLDPCPFYGFHWASLSLDEFAAWAASGGRLPIPNPASSQAAPDGNEIDGEFLVRGPDGEDLQLEPLACRTLYSDFEVSNPSSVQLEPSRSFNLDIAGPRLAFCGGPLVDLLLKSGASNYLEFKSVEATYIWSGGSGPGSGLALVPDSRASIFQDRTLSLTEKRHLMRFFKLVQDSGQRSELSAEDLESPFVDFLDQHRLPSSIKSIILYAIALADYDQEQRFEEPSTTLRTKDGIDSLVLYLSSIGRFANALGPFLYPVYGEGELPQAFCRSAAVKGAVYVLRMPVTALLIDRERRIYKGIQTASGQYLFSQKLVSNSSIILPSTLPSSLAGLRVGETELADASTREPSDTSMSANEHILLGIQERQTSHTSVAVSEDIHSIARETQTRILQDLSRTSWKVARSVCITNQSLQPELSSVLVIFPPRSIGSGLRTTIRALQLGSNTSACPQGMFTVYFSTLCSDIAQGKESLNAAINSLFKLTTATHSEDNATSSDSNDMSNEGKPTLLWSTFFVQHLAEASLLNPIAACCMPDGTLDYRGLVMSTTKMFQDLFPTEELFPGTVDPEGTAENGDVYTDNILENGDV